VIVMNALMSSGREWLATAWTLDVAVLLVPHWITGVRRSLTNDPLAIKVRLLRMIMDTWEAERGEGEVMCPQLLVLRGPRGEMPCDAKLVLRFEKLGEAFPGLQVQIAVNRVQGRDYPYLYCVLVARERLAMPDRLKPQPPSGILAKFEQSEADRMDILVLRQRTALSGGYHTVPSTCRSIFLYAMILCRQLESASAGSPPEPS